mmetsp:Transcript_30076/g.87604  ORF Transcript_30076/g.87604 Transcript_30076/m.87604 type:complete len:714 (-) Transcript_30076:17-2158(-)
MDNVHLGVLDQLVQLLLLIVSHGDRAGVLGADHQQDDGGVPVLRQLSLAAGLGEEGRVAPSDIDLHNGVPVLVLRGVDARLVVRRVRYHHSRLEEAHGVLDGNLGAHRGHSHLVGAYIHAQTAKNLGHNVLVPRSQVGHVATACIRVRARGRVPEHPANGEVDEAGLVRSGDALVEAFELPEALHVRDGMLSHVRQATLEVTRGLGLGVVVALDAHEVQEVHGPGRLGLAHDVLRRSRVQPVHLGLLHGEGERDLLLDGAVVVAELAELRGHFLIERRDDVVQERLRRTALEDGEGVGRRVEGRDPGPGLVYLSPVELGRLEHTREGEPRRVEVVVVQVVELGDRRQGQLPDFTDRLLEVGKVRLGAHCRTKLALEVVAFVEDTVGERCRKRHSPEEVRIHVLHHPRDDGDAVVPTNVVRGLDQLATHSLPVQPNVLGIGAIVSIEEPEPIHERLRLGEHLVAHLPRPPHTRPRPILHVEGPEQPLGTGLQNRLGFVPRSRHLHEHGCVNADEVANHVCLLRVTLHVVLSRPEQSLRGLPILRSDKVLGVRATGVENVVVVPTHLPSIDDNHWVAAHNVAHVAVHGDPPRGDVKGRATVVELDAVSCYMGSMVGAEGQVLGDLVHQRQERVGHRPSAKEQHGHILQAEGPRGRLLVQAPRVQVHSRRRASALQSARSEPDAARQAPRVQHHAQRCGCGCGEPPEERSVNFTRP